MLTLEAFMALQKQVEALAQKVKTQKEPRNHEVSSGEHHDDEEEAESQEDNDAHAESRAPGIAKIVILRRVGSHADPKNEPMRTPNP